MYSYIGYSAVNLGYNAIKIRKKNQIFFEVPFPFYSGTNSFSSNDLSTLPLVPEGYKYHKGLSKVWETIATTELVYVQCCLRFSVFNHQLSLHFF